MWKASQQQEGMSSFPPPPKVGLGPFQSRHMCKLCDMRFTSTFCRKLHSHFHEVNGLKCQKSLKRCNVCNKSFERQATYKFHKQYFHKKKEKDSSTTTIFPLWYVSKSSLSASKSYVSKKKQAKRMNTTSEILGKP